MLDECIIHSSGIAKGVAMASDDLELTEALWKHIESATLVLRRIQIE